VPKKGTLRTKHTANRYRRQIFNQSQSKEKCRKKADANTKSTLYNMSRSSVFPKNQTPESTKKGPKQGRDSELQRRTTKHIKKRTIFKTPNLDRKIKKKKHISPLSTVTKQKASHLGRGRGHRIVSSAAGDVHFPRIRTGAHTDSSILFGRNRKRGE